jgi:hypothetical protein
MPAQFLHGEIFALKGSHGKNSIANILAEAQRKEGYCSHVLVSQPPVPIYGVRPDLVLPLVEDRVRTAKDRNGRSFPHTFAALLGVVVSLPYSPGEVEEDSDLSANATRFFDESVEFMKSECGQHAVVCALKHVDEAQLHAHIFVVPEPNTVTHVLSIETVWAPSRAQGIVRRAGGSHKDANDAFKRAAQELQDRFYAAVGARSGLERIGPARKRLKRAKHLARRDDAELEAEIAAEVERRVEEVVDDVLREADLRAEDIWRCAIADAVAATERQADARVAAVEAEAARLRKDLSRAAKALEELLRRREEVARPRTKDDVDPSSEGPRL